MNALKSLTQALSDRKTAVKVRALAAALVVFALVGGVTTTQNYVWGQQETAVEKNDAAEKKSGAVENASDNPSSDEDVPEKKDESNTSHLSEAGKMSVENFDATVWVLISLFLFALSVTIERSIYIMKNKGNNPELVDTLLSGLSESSEDPKDLIEKCQVKKFGIEGRVAAKTLQGWHFGVGAMHEFASAAIEAEKRSLDKRLVVLSTLGNNTPFIGLLGTVLGIMKAFRDLAMIGDAGPAVVMKGISEALIATAFGLGVAIPCVIAFNVLSKRVQSSLSNSEEIVKILSGIRTAFDVKGAEGVKNYTVDARDPGQSGKNAENPGQLAGGMA